MEHMNIHHPLISTLKTEAVCTMGHWQHCKYPFDAESSSRDNTVPEQRITPFKYMGVHGGKIHILHLCTGWRI
jgi:hypothetical protein